MKAISAHLSRCFIAGIVALLPIGGLALTVVYMETTIAESWLAKQPFYFPGMGLLAVAVIVYAIGLFVSTVLGQWLWSCLDKTLNNLPALGRMYQTLKQILGYGEGQDGMFHEVVLVPSRDTGAVEIGLVTNQIADESGLSKLIVFVPGAPNPTIGRMLVIEPSLVHRINVPVSEALKALVSVGKASLLVEQPMETLIAEKAAEVRDVAT